MATLVVKVGAGSQARAELSGQQWPCVVGRAGVVDAAHKREGDGATPLGKYKILYGFYRPDRVSAPTDSMLRWLPLRPDFGWCDDPTDPAYNQFVPAGYGASHEQLWREDSAYDRVLVISHNMPAVAGLGSAVFIHQLHPGKDFTAGCVAFAPEALEEILALSPQVIEISRAVL